MSKFFKALEKVEQEREPMVATAAPRVAEAGYRGGDHAGRLAVHAPARVGARARVRRPRS